MPTYEFKNTETGEVFEKLLGISAKEEYLKDNPHIQQYFSKFPGMMRGTDKWNPANNKDAGWNENLARIAEANPNSALAEKVGGRGIKDTKISNAVRKNKGLNKDYKMDFDSVDKG
jgi:hypothetical protein